VRSPFNPNDFRPHRPFSYNSVNSWGYNISMQRQLVLSAALAAAVLGLVVWWVVAGWGLITLNFKDQPISAVLGSIEKQAGIRVVTNLPGDTRVTVVIQRARLPAVLDLLAARSDASWHWAWFLAPQKQEIENALMQISSGARVENWRGFESRGGFLMLDVDPIDPRLLAWKPEGSGKLQLQALANQASQKTGVTFAVPESWNPPVKGLPASGKLTNSIPRLARSVGGTAVPAVILMGMRRDQREAAGSGDGPPLGEWMGVGRLFASGRGRDREQNPRWADERMEQMIQMLPKEEQTAARQEVAESRAFWQMVRALPEAERRAKIEERMQNPEILARMEERAAAQDALRTPEQRAQRYQRYVERKQTVRNGGANATP